MREEEFDKIIKQQVDKQIQAPAELKNRIKTEIRNINVKPKRNMKVIQGIAAVFTVAILGATTYAGVTGNLSLEKMGLLKASENYDENAVDINQTISNEYADITLKSIACDNAYIIEEYQINLKEKAIEEYGNVEYDNRTGYKIYLNQCDEINGQYADIMTMYATKTGEREFQYFVVINIAKVKEKKIKLETEISNLILNDGEQNLLDDEEKRQGSIDISKKINIDIERSNTQVQEFRKIEKKIGNKTIIIEEVANTNFETFIKVKEITENTTFKEYQDNIVSYNSFLITQTNGENLPYLVRDDSAKLFVTRHGEKIDVQLLQEWDIEDDELVTLEENFVISIGKAKQQVNKVAITPIKTTFLNDRTDEEGTRYDKAQWYKLENKKYSAKSSMGGTLEIENIEITDDEIIFYYNKIGNIGNEQLVLMRNNNGKYNYSYSAIEEEKGITGNENKLVFLRKDTGRSGEYGYDMTTEEFENLLNDDISNLEFTMLFGSTTEKIGEAFEVEIPKLNKQTIKVKNIQIEDIELEIYEDEMYDYSEDNLEYITEDEDYTDLTNSLLNDEIVEGYEKGENEIIERLKSISNSTAKMKEGRTSINGIKLGMTREEVARNIEKIEGNGIDSEELEGSGILREYYGENFVIEYIKENEQYYAFSIYSTQEDVQTDKGIKLGDSLEEVVSKYYKDNNFESIEVKEEYGTRYALYGKEELQELERQGTINESSEGAFIQFSEDGYIILGYLSKGESLYIVFENERVVDVELAYDRYVRDGV